MEGVKRHLRGVERELGEVKEEKRGVLKKLEVFERKDRQALESVGSALLQLR